MIREIAFVSKVFEHASVVTTEASTANCQLPFGPTNFRHSILGPRRLLHLIALRGQNEDILELPLELMIAGPERSSRYRDVTPRDELGSFVLALQTNRSRLQIPRSVVLIHSPISP
jgi:hypothetical protein